MASLITRPESKYWIALFTDARGRQLKRSTKIPAEKPRRLEAMKIADEFEKAGRAMLSANQARSVITSLMEQAGTSMDEVTARQWSERWLSRKKPEVCASSFRFYAGTVEMWLKWLEGKADAALSAQTPDSLLDYRNFLATRMTNQSVNHRMVAMGMILRAARADRLITENPAEFLKPLKVTGGERAHLPFTERQIKALLQVSEPEWRSMILHGAYTGQRISDIAMLAWENVDLVGKTIRLRTRKTGRWLNLPLAPALFDHLISWGANKDTSSGFIHPACAAHVVRTGTCVRLSNQFADIMVMAGIRKLPQGRECQGRSAVRMKYSHSFHSLRHTATSWMKAAGVPASVVMDFIGHDDASMSRLYTHTGDEAMRRAAESLPALT